MSLDLYLDGSSLCTFTLRPDVLCKYKEKIMTYESPFQRESASPPTHQAVVEGEQGQHGEARGVHQGGGQGPPAHQQVNCCYHEYTLIMVVVRVRRSSTGKLLLQ